MTDADHHPEVVPGIARYPINDDSALPHNHHGEPVAPITAARLPYAYCWTDTDAGEMVFAESAEALLNYWWPGYQAADPAGRARMIAEHAVTMRAALAAELVVEAQRSGTAVSADEEAVVLADLDEIPDLLSWTNPVPLVLLEGMYRPFTDRVPPVSGIDGDVREPSNIVWIRNSDPDRYIQSLAQAGLIQLDTYADSL